MKYLVTLLFILITIHLHAQDEFVEIQDSLYAEGVDLSDTIRFQSKWPDHKPGKASLYSAILPGLGQAYNKSYWKIPIIYGGFTGIAYWVSVQNQQYQTALRCLQDIRDDDPETLPLECNNGNVSEEQLESLADRFRRDRDYWIILGALFYGLNIVEAHVDAHLKEFSVNEELSFKLKPSFDMLPYGQMYSGIGIKMTLP